MRLFIVGALLFLGLIFSATAQLVTPMTLTSPAFASNGIIPDVFTFSLGSQCSGSNLSPPLAVANIPVGTQSLALKVIDPDGGNWLHWKAWNISASTSVIPQNVSAAANFSQGVNSFGTIGYGGPCPPTPSHHYVFTLYALASTFSVEPTDEQLQGALAIANLTGIRSPNDSVKSNSLIPVLVRLQTALGPIEIELFDTAAPLSVANFLSYVNSGAYNNSFIHRSVPGFIIQGGGYTWDSVRNQPASVIKHAPVMNEYSPTRSNLRGTIAMAKLGGDPNSATSEWFINLANNSSNLDAQNGGFTVFGRVIGSGMQVVDAIAALPTANASGAFANLPLASTVTGSTIQSSNLAILSRASAMLALGAVNLSRGWNLLGNGVTTPLNVPAKFGGASNVATVWKWMPATQKWAFYSPSLADGGVTYAASKGYDFLSTIEAGEGFWVNVKQPFSVLFPSAEAVQSTDFMPAATVSSATSGGTHALPQGWSLISTGDNPTPILFDAALATGSSTPLQAGQAYTSFTTLWAWDALNAGWYFWAPSLFNDGTLANYGVSKSYLDFAMMPNTPIGSISPTTGFWVNKP
jgi:Raf kinase inhibitor-like YbhB/YbcL family protein